MRRRQDNGNDNIKNIFDLIFGSDLISVLKHIYPSKSIRIHFTVVVYCVVNMLTH